MQDDPVLILLIKMCYIEKKTLDIYFHPSEIEITIPFSIYELPGMNRDFLKD